MRVVLARNPDYLDKGRPYVDEYVILSTPDAATRLAAFRTGQSDIIWVAEPVRGGDGPQDQPRRRRAGDQERAGAVRPGAGAGQAALQRRARAARHLHGHRPPEAGRHRVRGPRHPRLGRAVHLLPGHDADGGPARPVVAVPSGGGEEAAGRGRPSQRLRDDALLLRVLPADDLAGAARPAGPEEEPQHQRQDHQAGLHELLRPLRRGQVGRDGLGVPVGPRGGPRRADVSVHALQVDEELLPRQRSRHRRADHQAAADARSRRAARDRQEDRRSRVRPGAADVDAVRHRLPDLPAAPAEHGRGLPAQH